VPPCSSHWQACLGGTCMNAYILARARARLQGVYAGRLQARNCARACKACNCKLTEACAGSPLPIKTASRTMRRSGPLRVKKAPRGATTGVGAIVARLSDFTEGVLRAVGGESGTSRQCAGGLAARRGVRRVAAVGGAGDGGEVLQACAAAALIFSRQGLHLPRVPGEGAVVRGSGWDERVSRCFVSRTGGRRVRFSNHSFGDVCRRVAAHQAL